MNIKLTEMQIEEYLQQQTDWKRVDEKWITRRYRFKQFMDGIDFVQAIAEYSEDVNHHPFISIDYKVVTLRLTSWNAGGLTELDFQCTKKYNDIYELIAQPKGTSGE